VTHLLELSSDQNFASTLITQKQLTMVIQQVTQPLPAHIALKVEAGIKKAASEWGVNLPQGAKYSFIAKSPRTGNRSIKEATKSTYDNHYKQLWNFCAIIGDYESLLLLVSPVFGLVPAMKVESLEAFVRYKRKSPEFALFDTNGAPILDIEGKQM
jgi:hypothetical protein